MNPHRTQPEVEPEVHRGGRKHCPACGVRGLLTCIACKDSWRVQHDQTLPSKCPTCSLNIGSLRFSTCITKVTYCSPVQRQRTRWWGLRACDIPGAHLHQSCTHCNAKWIYAVLVEDM